MDPIENGLDDVVEIGVVAIVFALLRKGWPFVLGLLFPFICILYFMTRSDLLEQKKESLAKRSMYDAVKIGDSVFVNKASILDSDKTVTIYQLYRAKEASDIEKMKLPKWKKKQLIDQLDTIKNDSGEPVYTFRSVIMYKRNSSFIGVVIQKDTALLLERIGLSQFHFQIKPFKKKFDHSYNVVGDEKIPEEKYFVSANDVDTIDFFKMKHANNQKQ